VYITLFWLDVNEAFPRGYHGFHHEMATVIIMERSVISGRSAWMPCYTDSMSLRGEWNPKRNWQTLCRKKTLRRSPKS